MEIAKPWWLVRILWVPSNRNTCKLSKTKAEKGQVAFLKNYEAKLHLSSETNSTQWAEHWEVSLRLLFAAAVCVSLLGDASPCLLKAGPQNTQLHAWHLEHDVNSFPLFQCLSSGKVHAHETNHFWARAELCSTILVAISGPVIYGLDREGWGASSWQTSIGLTTMRLRE